MRLLRFLVVLALVAVPVTGRSFSADIPDKLTDAEFWRLTDDLSEPDGTFRSDNVLSNEMVFARLLPDLLARTTPGGVYLGVGPEQNFTYIVAMRARIAFITDIRRANLHLLLVYKALFELSADRAEFLSRLFTKPRPAGLSKTSSIAALMTAFWTVDTADEAAYTANLDAIQRHLTKTHAFPDLEGRSGRHRPRVSRVLLVRSAHELFGQPQPHAALGRQRRDVFRPDDADRRERAAADLSRHRGEVRVREGPRYAKNLIVPVVGNFSGPKAIRAIGAYVEAAAPPCPRSTCPRSSRTSSGLDRSARSARTSPRCRSDDESVFIRPGNLANLAAGGAPVAPPAADTPRLGTYQIGVIVPIATGCN